MFFLGVKSVIGNGMIRVKILTDKLITEKLFTYYVCIKKNFNVAFFQLPIVFFFKKSEKKDGRGHFFQFFQIETKNFPYLRIIIRNHPLSMKQSDCIVIIPTYNEKENIEKIIRAVFALEKAFHILVIDDGSPDGTADIVKRLMQTDFLGELFLIERSGKQGLGTAYIAGFKWALEHKYDYIFEMDADFSHDPNDLPRLYSACADEGYDLAIGSRYISGVNVINWPMSRVLMSYFASMYVRLITGLKIQDTTAGFKCYKRRVLSTIQLDKIRFKGYAFQIEMKYTTYKCGFKIKEVPVVFVNRVEGVSKMNGSIFSEAFFGVIRLRLDGWFKKYPKINEE